MEHFTRGVAKELSARRVSVNAIGPGPMDTRMTISSIRDCSASLMLFLAFFYPQETPDAVEFHKSMAMEGRLTKIEDIAPIVRFLVTEGHW